MEATRYRYKVGELTVTEQSRAISRHATSYANLIDAKNKVNIALARLEEVVGSTLDDQEISVPNPTQELFDLPLEEVLPLLEKRFDVMAARNRVDEAEKNLGAKKAGHYPTININSDVSRTWDQDSTSKPGVNDSVAIELEVSLPIYSGGATESKRTQAKFERDGNRPV